MPVIGSLCIYKHISKKCLKRACAWQREDVKMWSVSAVVCSSTLAPALWQGSSGLVGFLSVCLKLLSAHVRAAMYSVYSLLGSMYCTVHMKTQLPRASPFNMIKTSRTVRRRCRTSSPLMSMMCLPTKTTWLAGFNPFNTHLNRV